MPIKYLLLVLLFGSTSCIKEIAINTPEYMRVPVVNAIFTSDSTLFLHVSQTQRIQSLLQEQLVYDSIQIHENGTLWHTMPYLKNGIFALPQKLIPNKEYKLSVFVGNKHVWAIDTFPTKTTFTTVQYIPNSKIDNDNLIYDNIQIQFASSKTQFTMYEIIFSIATDYSTGLDTRSPYTNYPYIQYENGGFDALFTNALFIDTLVTPTFSTYKQPEDLLYIIRFKTISKEYFNYKKTIENHFDFQESDIWTGSGNPIDLYSNIHGGYGIFGAYQEVRDTIKIIQ